MSSSQPEHDGTNDTISRTIEALMTYKRVDRAEICQITHLSSSSFYNRINGAHGWTAFEVAAIAEHLGVKVQTLFDGLDLPGEPGFRTGSFSTLTGLPTITSGHNPTVNTTTGKPWTPHADTSTTSNCAVLPFRPSKRAAGCTAGSKRLAMIR